MAPVCMCVCVSPDCPGVTSAGLRHIRYLASLRILTLHGIRASVISERGGSWIRRLPSALQDFSVTGELRWHLHAHTAIVPPPQKEWMSKPNSIPKHMSHTLKAMSHTFVLPKNSFLLLSISICFEMKTHKRTTNFATLS